MRDESCIGVQKVGKGMKAVGGKEVSAEVKAVLFSKLESTNLKGVKAAMPAKE